MRNPRRTVRPHCERLDDRCLPSGLTVAQLTHAYGLESIAFPTASGTPVAGDGSGETIALIEAYHDPTLGSDLHAFDQANNLPDPSLSVVNQAGAVTNPSWDAEESLDVEWSHAIAPGATILVVEAKSDTLSDLMKAVNVARNTPGVAAISMSWGFNESSSETSFDSTFRTPAGHQGITFVASSGDDGTSAGPEYPSSSPNVLAVGGTTLLVDEAGAYYGEAAWSGSGGGFSPFEREPAYQRSVQKSGHRSTPDVAFDADPYTGVEVYQTPLGSSTGIWLTVGGTSLGSPSWAAIIAIVDQGRALQGKPSLDGPTQTLPALYSLPATDLNTVAMPPPYSPWGGGVNPVGSPPSGGDFLRHQRNRSAGAAAGANIATGLGSPVGPLLISGLVASDVTLPTSRSAARAAAHAHASVRSMDHADHPRPSHPHRRSPAQ